MRNVSVVAGFCCLGLLFVCASQGNAYEIQPVNQGGGIQGQVFFAGTPPAPLVVEVDKGPEVCGKERQLVKVETQNGWLSGAVILVEGIQAGKPFPVQAFSGKLPGEGEFRYQGGERLGLQVKTKGCSFGPFTGVVAVEDPVIFENQDSIKHTLHTFASMDSKGIMLRTIHNQDIHPMDSMARTFEVDKLRGSRVVRITCNRHDFMQNWLYVVDHPYFAISDQDGRFAIHQIPPGRYTVLAWHPILGEQRQDVHIASGGQVTLEFRFSRAQSE